MKFDIEKNLGRIRNIMVLELKNWKKNPEKKADSVLTKTLVNVDALQKNVKDKDIRGILNVFNDGIINNVFTDSEQVFQQWVNVEKMINQFLLEKTAA